ncbi:MAG TPA: YoaK family protein, partial [Pyrinomonadaceae bacterium]|nr:YoaK family protein [Pyrinomonadaceae bacterium]
MTPETRLNPSLPLLLHIATAITGLIDAISYLALGHVFTANMTGNVVFLAFAVAGAPGLSITRSLTALVAFLAGALIGGRVATSLSGVLTPSWITTALSLESALLLVATLAAINFRDSSGSSFQLYSIIVLTACAMGIRNATV